MTKPWNDLTKTHEERRRALDELLPPKERGFLPPPPQDWQVYEVEVRFPDHPDLRWRKGVTWEVAAVSEVVAAKKALAKSRQIYGLRTRLLGNHKKAKRVKTKRFPGPRWAIMLPSPFSVQYK
jgi:hypothetical protein